MTMNKLHTILSQETIKPSSPTPSHLRTHILSLGDLIAPNIHIPLVLFYQNYKNEDIGILKKSLSECLTQYYPFAGRLLEPSAPHIDCNDQGVEFLEASINSPLHEFIETLDLEQLIPHALGCPINKTSPNTVEIQLTRFTCGGVAVAVSISHKIADACTMLNFVNHWATLTRGGSPVNPIFIPCTPSNIKFPEISEDTEACKVRYISKKFVFPNSKLNELKNKINKMAGTSPLNPTRVESMTSLLFKCAVNAATTKSGSFQPSNLSQVVNLREKIVASCPQLATGNKVTGVFVATTDSSQTELTEVITRLRGEILKLQGLRDVEEANTNLLERLMSTIMNDQNRTYFFSSVCRFPFYEVDFGWGNPLRVVLQRTGNTEGSVFASMDTPFGDGIEVTVQLQEDEMAIFQKDEELLAYVEHI